MERIVRAETSEQLEQARVLFQEYAASLGFELDFQDFDSELARFPGEYSSPTGCILLAVTDGKPIGCVAVRALDRGTCEMKRLYVAPAFRGRSMGRALAKRVAEEARRLGYERMRLDTVPSMKAAIRLYESLGFAQTPPYRHNPIEGASFMELALK
jgi:ribosomal protein S18 acetylase RimI-like enzyme